MLNRIEIRNFQSLKKVDLDLGQFTVIVGPSSSGKSALIRACKALASNVRGSGVITRGQKRAAITGYTDRAKVTLERTEAASTYQLLQDGNAVTFTKLAGAVPEHITKALRVAPVPVNGASVNFAGQFDRPFLLDDTGANVARELGELTNVTAIFEAVRAANKIRLNAASTLKTRRGDLDAVKTRLKDFHGLSDRLKALHEAEQLAASAQQLQSDADRLERAVTKLRLAESQLSARTLPHVPDVEPLNAALNRLLDFRAKLGGVQAKIQRAEQAENTYLAALRAAKQTEESLGRALADIGTCPTCGRPIE